MSGCDGKAPPGVQARIEQGDPWYVNSQFEWASKPEVRRIYEKRFRFFCECLEKARKTGERRVRMLDAGCGDGYWISRLKSVPDLEIDGIDYNPVRIERVKKMMPGVNIRVGDLMELTATSKYDVVLLNQVIEHVDDDAGLLRKIRGVLRPGGMLILGTTNEGCFLQRWSLKRRGEAFKTDHVHFYTESGIRKVISKAGFCVQKVMREVFYPGSDRIFYGMTRRNWGFRLLEWMTWLCPSQCSDYYFRCVSV